MLGLFRPKNSIIILFDPSDDESQLEFEGQVTEIKQYYRPVTLPVVVNSEGNRPGCVAFVFKNPRRFVFHRSLPFLMDVGIPFTLFLQPDCVGTNQLPIGEPVIPVEKMDPQRLFVTWKKILELPKELAELGVWLPPRAEELKEATDFVRKQTGQGVRCAFDASHFREEYPDSVFAEAGIESLVTLDVGAVEKDTNPMRLPQYVPEKI